MNDLVTFPDKGLPEWTQIGSETGLDPLGMTRPSEIIYQGLLPGISTITVRLRYYSFLPWILHVYASEIGDTDPEVFFKFQRNAEALFALIGVHDDYDAGLSGANWALRFLRENLGETLDFAESARQSENGLLRNKSGALGGIYGPQLEEMGLITSTKFHTLKVTTELGTQMAIALEATLGPQSQILKKAIHSGSITRPDLADLQLLKPSNIDPSSEEGKLLKNILLGEIVDPTAEDQERRDSLCRMLEYSNLYGTIPTAENVRWHWFDQLKDKANLDSWLLYHVNDLLVLSYELLLKKSLEMMQASVDKSVSWREIPDLVFSPSLGPREEEPFFRDMDLSGDEKKLADKIVELGGTMETVSDEAISAAATLIQTILCWARAREEDVVERFKHAVTFQSLWTELMFVQSIGEVTVREAISTILIERVLKRHLWVASRKFRNQSKYTFLFEPDEGRIRFRNNYSVVLGYPRIPQAVQFLMDLKLLDEETGLSKLGRKTVPSHEIL